MKQDSPLLFLIAGEASGDQLGAGLMSALVENYGPSIRFAGVGGDEMMAQGLNSHFPMSELSVMGLVEILPRIPKLLGRIKDTAKLVHELKPNVIVTIDSPGFTFRLAKRLKNTDIPIIHYVAPTVWAWKAGRARKMTALFDHLMVLLPFETKYFEDVGLRCTFVGHPGAVARAGDSREQFLKRHNIKKKILLGVFPGSRKSEVRRMLPLYGEVVRLLCARYPSLHLVLVTVPALRKDVEIGIRNWQGPVTLLDSTTDRWGAYKACDVALATSGTVTTELAAANTPMVVAYRMAPITMAIARRLVKVPYVTLINLVLKKNVIPEFIQNACKADSLSGAVSQLLDDETARTVQRSALQIGVDLLRGAPPSPARRAASVVQNAILTSSVPNSKSEGQ